MTTDSRSGLWRYESGPVLAIEPRVREGHRAGFYGHLKPMNLERKRDHSSQFIIDENSNLRGDEFIRVRWVRWFFLTLLISNPPKLDANITVGLDKCPRTHRWESSLGCRS